MGACPARSRCDAARAYGDTTRFFAVALEAGFGAADGVAAWAEAAIAMTLAAVNIAATPYLRRT
jgi:hypothetical protein